MRETKPLSDAEITLLVEEMKLKCVPGDIGFGIDINHRRLPALYVHTDLKRTGTKYEGANVDSVWSIAQDQGRVLAVFLELYLQATDIGLKICFDEFTGDFLEWMDLLVKNGGEIALTDNPDPETGGIQISGITLDIPTLLLKAFKFKVNKPAPAEGVK